MNVYYVILCPDEIPILRTLRLFTKRADANIYLDELLGRGYRLQDLFVDTIQVA